MHHHLQGIHHTQLTKFFADHHQCSSSGRILLPCGESAIDLLFCSGEPLGVRRPRDAHPPTCIRSGTSSTSRSRRQSTWAQSVAPSAIITGRLRSARSTSRPRSSTSTTGRIYSRTTKRPHSKDPSRWATLTRTTAPCATVTAHSTQCPFRT